jgi:hypothetical protein
MLVAEALIDLHVLVWWRRRDARANLLFALTAMAAAVFAACELWMMWARDARSIRLGAAVYVFAARRTLGLM